MDKVRRCCYDLLNEYQLRAGMAKCLDEYSNTSSSSFVSKFGGQDSLSGYDKFVSQKKRSRVVQSRLELDLYLDEEVLPRDPDFDILGWWKSN